MTMFPSEGVPQGSFLRNRWVGIHLYDGRKVSVPVEVPARDVEVVSLTDAELLCLYVLVFIASVGRGTSVDGWPRWAQEVAAGTDRWPSREKLNRYLYKRVLIRSSHNVTISADFNPPMPVVTDTGQIEFEDGSTYWVHELLEGGRIKKHLWLRPSPSQPS